MPNGARSSAASPQNRYRLLFVAPERLLTPWFLQMIGRLNVKTFAIDEAHCISQWGHDFRPEYRQLATLKQRFPGASVHAYTATATPRVREDIIAQLKLENPIELVGTFDRPNLIYRILPRVDVQAQVIDVVRRHAGEAVIVYCISRKDTEAMAEALRAQGVKAAAYHAGMEKEPRRETQEAFAKERLDVVVATVAFGMGIDRSNVRCVVHAAMPKTVEHYQQETGRAGRDGLEAECILFYSAQDILRWEKLIQLSAEKVESPEAREQAVAGQLELLNHMKRMCRSVHCRHGALSRYFGQEYLKPNCGACDICLGELESMADSTVVAQKILSCVARVQQRFGIGHVVDVLMGADTEMIRRCGHAELSTYGLMKETPKKALQNLVYQLVDQGLLERVGDDRPILKLNEDSLAVLKGQRPVQLIEPKVRVRRTKVEEASWENVDRGLFDHLRAMRKEVAAQRNVPAFVIFADSTLRDLAAVRPSDARSLRRVKGIGERKMADFGERVLEAITTYCRANGLSMDNGIAASIEVPKKSAPNSQKQQAFAMFARGQPVEAVAEAIGRARSTTEGYLQEFVDEHKPESVAPWVDAETYRKVAAAAMKFEDRRLKPIFEHLGGEVPYEQIRVVLSHLQARGTATLPGSRPATTNAPSLYAPKNIAAPPRHHQHQKRPHPKPPNPRGNSGLHRPPRAVLANRALDVAPHSPRLRRSPGGRPPEPGTACLIRRVLPPPVRKGTSHATSLLSRVEAYY